MATVESVMQQDVVMANPQDDLRDVLQRMNARQVGAVLVVDNGVLAGIFSERDLLNRVILRDLEIREIQLKDVFTPAPVFVHPWTHLKECARVIHENQFRHLPVVDDANRPVGIISSRVFLGYMLEVVEAYVDLAQPRLTKEVAEAANRS